MRVSLEKVSPTVDRALAASVRVLWIQVISRSIPRKPLRLFAVSEVDQLRNGKRLTHTETSSATIWCQRTSVRNHCFELAVSTSTPKLLYLIISTTAGGEKEFATDYYLPKVSLMRSHQILVNKPDRDHDLIALLRKAVGKIAEQGVNPRCSYC